MAMGSFKILVVDELPNVRGFLLYRFTCPAFNFSQGAPPA